MTSLNNPYLVEHLRCALAEDPRVGESAVRVFVVAGRIWLEGHVTSEERKRSAEVVVRELAPGVEVKNELQVIVIGGPGVESIER